MRQLASIQASSIQRGAHTERLMHSARSGLQQSEVVKTYLCVFLHCARIRWPTPNMGGFRKGTFASFSRASSERVVMAL